MIPDIINLYVLVVIANCVFMIKNVFSIVHGTIIHMCSLHM